MGKPPRLLQYFLKKVIPEADREFLLGDYEYLFNDIRETKGKINAQIWYWNHFFRTVPEFISNFMYWGFSMFFNYVKIAFRNIKKQKLYTAINLSGLAIAENADSDVATVTVNLTEPCRAPGWFYPPAP